MSMKSPVTLLRINFQGKQQRWDVMRNKPDDLCKSLFCSLLIFSRDGPNFRSRIKSKSKQHYQ